MRLFFSDFRLCYPFHFQISSSLAAIVFGTVLRLISCLQAPWEEAERRFNPQQIDKFYAPAERRSFRKLTHPIAPVITFPRESNELDTGSSSLDAAKAARSSRSARRLNVPREPRRCRLDELDNQDLASSSIGDDAAVVTAYDASKDWKSVSKTPSASRRRSEDFLENRNAGYIFPSQWSSPVRRPLYRTSEQPIFFDYRLAETQRRQAAGMREYKRRAAIAKQKLRLTEQSKSEAKSDSNFDKTGKFRLDQNLSQVDIRMP